MSEQAPDRASNNISGRKNGHEPDSCEKLVCWQFIEEYAQSFARHFDKSFKEAAGETARESTPPVSGSELYYAPVYRKYIPGISAGSNEAPCKTGAAYV